MTTQRANATYQEIIDLHTESDTVSVIGIHTPSDSTPQKMLGGFFRQFRKFKYYGASLAMVPAARLPADPLQVSYEAGEATIDPRDMLNPILWHGCHGNDMGAILNQFYVGANNATVGDSDFTRMYGTSVEMNTLSSTAIGNQYLESLYYRALTDNTWSKAHPQQGFRKAGLRPMVYSLASNMQLNPKSFVTGSGTGTTVLASANTEAQSRLSPSFGQGAGGVLQESTLGPAVTSQARDGIAVGNMPGPTGTQSTGGTVNVALGLNRSGLAFFTPRLTTMGWMDTRQPIGGITLNDTTSTALTGDPVTDELAIANVMNTIDAHNWTRIPKVFMGMILLPPAYKTEQYYRLIINHRIGFAGFRGQSMYSESDNDVVNAPSVRNWN